MNDMTNEIKVSIIMPVYNSGKYLRPAVDSILTQSMKEFELILVDDGSSDGSEKVCDEYAQAHPEGTFPIVRVIHQKNGGICKARNVAFSEARGEYIGFCDHDDIYLPGLIETAYTKAKQYDADVVKWGVDEKIVKEGREKQKRIRKYEERCYNPHDVKNEFMKILLGGIFDFVWDAFYKRDFVLKHNLKFDEWFKRGSEDITFMLNLASFLPIFVTLKEIFYRHYVRIGFSSSTQVYKYKAEEFYKVSATVAESLKRMNVDLDEIKDDYIFYLSSRYVKNILFASTMHTDEFNRKEFNNTLESLRTQEFLPSYFLDGNVKDVYRSDSKVGVLYYLFSRKHDIILSQGFHFLWIVHRIKAFVRSH